MQRQARWVLLLAAIAASVGVISVVDQGSHSVSDTLAGSLGYLAVIWLAAGVAYLVMARREA